MDFGLFDRWESQLETHKLSGNEQLSTRFFVIFMQMDTKFTYRVKFLERIPKEISKSMRYVGFAELLKNGSEILRVLLQQNRLVLSYLVTQFYKEATRISDLIPGLVHTLYTFFVRFSSFWKFTAISCCMLIKDCSVNVNRERKRKERKRFYINCFYHINCFIQTEYSPNRKCVQNSLEVFLQNHKIVECCWLL